MLHKTLFPLLLFFLPLSLSSQSEPLKIAVAGLSHTHVHWIFNSASHEAFDIVGVAEPNSDLAKRYCEQYDFPLDKVYDTLEELIEAQSPEAVTAFGTIYDHLSIVETCAPLGIHVMVEKPLAVSLEHARKMNALADTHNIHLLTNYETTWYPSNHKTRELIQEDTIIGAVRKIIVRDGHKGPKKIGVDPEFLEWLTDPILNGGGAIIDFGCYGANLVTWLMNGQRPNSVTAITAQLQPENNPLVDDEAIILLQYDSLVAVIQASWNWPIGRKDMEVYGLNGVVYADNRNKLRIRQSTGYDSFTEASYTLPEREQLYHDPFVYFANVINGTIRPEAYDLSSLENNMIVMEILDAAVQSARRGVSVGMEE